MEETKRDSSKSHMDAHASDLDVAMLLARRASGTRRASLMLLSERRDELYIVASSGVPPQIATRVRVCLGDDVAGMVAETGQPLLMNAWRSRKHRTRYHTSSFISVPVPHRDGSFGVLSVADPIAGVQLGPAELTLVEHIAQDIARGMEQAAHRSRARHFQQLMRQVPQHTAMVREEERARIAREMHDNVGSNLTAALFAIDSALAQLPREDPGPGATLERARIHLHSGITAVHDAVFSLHPAVLQREGLAGALRTLAADVAEGGECQVRLSIDDQQLPRTKGAALAHAATVRPLDETLELTLYRIAQEALTNIRKHSRATEAVVHLVLRRRLAVFRVDDNGIGIGEAVPSDDPRTGLGLYSLRERVEALGGRLDIGPRRGGGTTLIARLPVLARGHSRAA